MVFRNHCKMTKTSFSNIHFSIQSLWLLFIASSCISSLGLIFLVSKFSYSFMFLLHIPFQICCLLSPHLLPKRFLVSASVAVADPLPPTRFLGPWETLRVASLLQGQAGCPGLPISSPGRVSGEMETEETSLGCRLLKYDSLALILDRTVKDTVILYW